MARSNAVYLCVSIDCECDKGPSWRVRKPVAFSGIADGIGRRLEPLFRAHGAKATYLLSPEVMRDDQSAALLAKLETSAELGTHLHGELAPPDDFVPDVTDVFQRDYSPEVEAAKMTSLTGTFKSAFGHAPRSFRAGRFGIGQSSLGIVESLGYAVESSVTPGIDWTDSGAPGLHFRGAPTQPYHPDTRRPEARGDSPLWEVPVTVRPRAMNKLPFVGKHIEHRWLRPTKHSAAKLIALAKDEIAAARAENPQRPVVLNAMFHNVEVVPQASPYAQTEDEAQAILDRLAGLLAFARASSIAVVGLGDLPEILEEQALRSGPNLTRQVRTE